MPHPGPEYLSSRFIMQSPFCYPTVPVPSTSRLLRPTGLGNNLSFPNSPHLPVLPATLNPTRCRAGYLSPIRPVLTK